MFKTLLKTGLIHFGRQKLFSLINVVGLGLGISCCFLIALFVSHELSYEQQYSKAERIYLFEQSRARDQVMMEYSSFLAAPLLLQDFPAVEDAARFTPRSQPAMIATGNRRFREDGVKYADPSFLQMYDFTWLAGNPQQAFQEPQSIVLTQSFARKYFGTVNAVGNTLLLDDSLNLQVTGVIADLPGNTHLEFDALSTMSVFQTLTERLGATLESWNTALMRTYVLLREDADVMSLRQQLPAFSSRHLAQAGTQRSFNVRPITDLHLHGGYEESAAALDNLQRVQLFIALAAVILTIAVINFMNLSTARATHRAKEVGLKLSVGASRVQVIRQFLAESILMTGCAVVVAAVAVEFTLPLIERWTELDLAAQLPSLPQSLAVLVLSVLLLGIVAGAYPAHYLAGYQPSRVLKGELSRGKAGRLFREILVVFQFTAAIALIVATVVIARQMQLARNIDTGFQRELIYNVQLPYSVDFDVESRWPDLEAALESDPRISAVTYATTTPLMNNRIGIFARRPDIDERVRLELVQVEPDYLQTYQVPLIAGAYLSESNVREGVILNERAARQLQWSPAEAVGKGLLVNDKETTVVGVSVDTIHNVREEPLAQIYTATEFVPNGLAGRLTISLQLVDDDVAGALAHIEQVWRTQFPNEIVQGSFLDDQFNIEYRQEEVQGKMFSGAALLAVLIASIGLVGLASFNAERRTREIGIRKVMGSGVWNIVLLLTNDFSKLVLLSNLIAWPIAYFAMQRWLANFAYRIDLTPMVFIGSGAIALCIAWVTVGTIAARAAAQRPVLALRYE